MTRIHWSIRYSAFIASVFTLSLFFAGWRDVNTVCDLNSVALLTSGVVSTLMLLWLQAYWIYFEEKNKGTLRRSIKMFDSAYAFVEAKYSTNKLVRLIQPVASEEKGSN